MRQTLAAVAIFGLVALAGCKSGPKGPPPAAPTPPPVAPATPPPAPEPPPSRDVAPVEDEYSRLRNMASDEIERMGLLPDIHFDYDSADLDRKSTRLNSSHGYISYAVFCLKKKKK